MDINKQQQKTTNGSMTIPGSNGRQIVISNVSESVGGSIYGTTPGGMCSE